MQIKIAGLRTDSRHRKRPVSNGNELPGDLSKTQVPKAGIQREDNELLDSVVWFLVEARVKIQTHAIGKLLSHTGV
jgi:hypothetical protein